MWGTTLLGPPLLQYAESTVCCTSKCSYSLSAKTPQSSSASNSHRLEVWAQRLVHDIPIHQKYTNTLEEWATGMSLWIWTSAFPLSYRRCVFMTYGTILQQSLNEFREAHNAHVIRKQRGVELPTGHSPNAMWFQPQVLDAGIYASHWSRGVTSLWGLNKNWIALFCDAACETPLFPQNSVLPRKHSNVSNIHIIGFWGQ